MTHARVTAALVCVIVTTGLAGLSPCLWNTGRLFGQFNDERRRGDLKSLELPGGSVVEFKTMPSEALGAEQPYSIFLPPSFRTEPTRAYPVIYFLHGLNNDHTSWTVERYGRLQDRVEELILHARGAEQVSDTYENHH